MVATSAALLGSVELIVEGRKRTLICVFLLDGWAARLFKTSVPSSPAPKTRIEDMIRWAKCGLRLARWSPTIEFNDIEKIKLTYSNNGNYGNCAKQRILARSSV